MSALYTCPTCQDCQNISLPSVEFDDCKPEAFLESEIADIFVSYEDPLNPGVPVTGAVDFSDATEITTAFDGTNGIHLIGMGDKPEAEDNSRRISHNRIAFGPKNFTVNFTVDECNDTNYEMMRAMECGGEFFIWYTTLGGKAYGGPEGIKAYVTRADNPLDRGEGSYDRFEFTFQWKAKCNPPRTDYALAETNATAA